MTSQTTDFSLQLLEGGYTPVNMVVTDQHEYLCEEEKRLREDRERSKYWKKFGPYVAERQWATGAREMLL